MPAAECSTLPWEKNWSRSPKIIILSGDIEELGEMLRAVRSGRSVTRPHIQGHPAASPPLPGPPCARCGGGGRTDGARRSHKVGQTGPCARMERFELTRFPLSHLSENIDYRDTTIGRSGEKVYPPPPKKSLLLGRDPAGVTVSGATVVRVAAAAAAASVHIRSDQSASLVEARRDWCLEKG